MARACSDLFTYDHRTQTVPPGFDLSLDPFPSGEDERSHISAITPLAKRSAKPKERAIMERRSGTESSDRFTHAHASIRSRRRTTGRTPPRSNECSVSACMWQFGGDLDTNDAGIGRWNTLQKPAPVAALRHSANSLATGTRARKRRSAGRPIATPRCVTPL